MTNIPTYKININSNTLMSTVDLIPSEIKSAFEMNYNIQIQHTIDTIFKADSHFIGLFQTRLSAVNSMEMNFVPASEDKKDIDITEFVKKSIDRVLTHNILTEILKSVFWRFSAIEIIWKLENSKAIIEELITIPQSSFEYNPDQKHELQLFDKENEIYTQIPENKVIFTNSPLMLNNKPISITEIIAALVIIKHYALQKDWALFNEIYGMPLRLGKYSVHSSQEDVNALFETLKNMGRDTAGVISKDDEIEFVKSEGQGETFEKLIDKCNSEISKAIVGQTLTTENVKNVGSQALGNVHNLVRQDIALQDLKLIEDSINEQLIKPLVRFNYKTDKFPKLRMSFPKNHIELTDLDTKLSKLGVKFNKEYFINKYNLNEDDFEISEVTPPDETLSQNMIFNSKKKNQLNNDSIF